MRLIVMLGGRCAVPWSMGYHCLPAVEILALANTRAHVRLLETLPTYNSLSSPKSAPDARHWVLGHPLGPEACALLGDTLPSGHVSMPSDISEEYASISHVARLDPPRSTPYST